jgi:putative salt-induced outer membrane protein YdiY
MRTRYPALIALFVCLAQSLAAQEAAPPPPPPSWTTSVGAGLALTSGNSDTRSLNFSFNTAWDPKTDRTFKAEALYLRGDSDGEITVDKAAAGARYDLSFSERTFAFTEVSALRDPLKNIDYFISPLIGAGWFAIRNDLHFLRFDAAGGAVVERNKLLGTDTSGAVKAGQSYERKLSATSSVTQQVSGIWKVDDLDDASYHFATGLTATITPRSELKLSYVYDYRNRVSSPEIEKGDSALFAALLFKF